MPRYRQGQIFQQQPSLLHHILAALGGAAESLAGAYSRKKLGERQETTNLLEAVLSGQIDPAIFATETAQELMKIKGLAKRPEIQDLKTQALQQFNLPERIGEITPGGGAVNIPEAKPEAVPFAAYAQLQAQKEMAARRQKFFGEELPQVAIKEATLTRLRNEINQEFEETPEQVIMHISAIVEEAKKKAIPLQGLTYKGVDVLTAIEKARYATDQNFKALAGQGKYYQGVANTQADKARFVTLLTGLKSGTTSDSEATKELGALGVAGQVIDWFMQKPKRTLDDLKKILVEQNKTIKARNAENRVYAREGLMKPGDVEEVEPISDDILSDIEPTTTTTNPNSQLMTVTGRAAAGTPGKAKEIKSREPSSAEVEAEAQKLLAVRLVDPETGQIMTMLKARQIARQYLLSRGHGIKGR